MKKKLHRHIAIIIALALILSINVGAVGAVEDIKNTDVIRNQDAALNAYDKLAVYLGLDSVEKDPTWPEEYAGCYINDDDELVICLTDNSLAMCKKYRDICGDDIVFQSAEYSMHDVENLYELLCEIETDKGIRTVYNNKSNKVQILISDDNEQSVIAQHIDNHAVAIDNEARTTDVHNLNFSSLIEYITIETEKSEIISSDTKVEKELNTRSTLTDNDKYGRKYIKPGSTLKVGVMDENVLDETFSVGVWATKTIAGVPVTGLFTCGHTFFDSNNAFVTAYSNVYREESENEYINLGLVSANNVLYDFGTSAYDFAFIVPNDPLFQTYVPTSEAINGDRITSVYTNSSLPQGTIVVVGYKIAHNGLTQVTGSIVGNATGFANGNTINAGYIVDHGPYGPGTNKGDSGGPVYVIQGGMNKLLGIISSGYDVVVNYQGITTYRYSIVAKASVGFNALSATLYTGTGSEFPYF